MERFHAFAIKINMSSPNHFLATSELISALSAILLTRPSYETLEALFSQFASVPPEHFRTYPSCAADFTSLHSLLTALSEYSSKDASLVPGRVRILNEILKVLQRLIDNSDPRESYTQLGEFSFCHCFLLLEPIFKSNQ
jgi:hypothetical protein